MFQSFFPIFSLILLFFSYLKAVPVIKNHNFLQYDPYLFLSNYDYPLPGSSDSIEYIVIVATNDFHGNLVPMTEIYAENQYLKVSGLTLLSSYLDALAEEWQGNLLWLDAGDKFQGSIESNSFGGEPIIKFLNSKKKILKIATLGNHDFDFGFGNLTQRLTESHFDHLVANINNIYNDKPVSFPNTFLSKIYEVAGLKIGII